MPIHRALVAAPALVARVAVAHQAATAGAAVRSCRIDAETQQGLQVLERKNEVVDQQLEVVAEEPRELKSIALHMRDEVKVQSAMVDEITHKVESAGAHLSNLNKKMKDSLADARPIGLSWTSCSSCCSLSSATSSQW